MCHRSLLRLMLHSPVIFANAGLVSLIFRYWSHTSLPRENLVKTIFVGDLQWRVEQPS